MLKQWTQDIGEINQEFELWRHTPVHIKPHNPNTTVSKYRKQQNDTENYEFDKKTIYTEHWRAHTNNLKIQTL